MQLAEGDLERLLLTRRYWTLQAMVTSPTGMTGDLVDAELADRGTMLEDTIRETREGFQRWSRVQRLIVADTSVYCQHPKKLEELDLASWPSAARSRSSWLHPCRLSTSWTA